jgi:hypothetical protein
MLGDTRWVQKAPIDIPKLPGPKPRCFGYFCLLCGLAWAAGGRPMRWSRQRWLDLPGGRPCEPKKQTLTAPVRRRAPGGPSQSPSTTKGGCGSFVLAWGDMCDLCQGRTAEPEPVKDCVQCGRVLWRENIMDLCIDCWAFYVEHGWFVKAGGQRRYSTTATPPSVVGGTRTSSAASEPVGQE